MFNFFRIFMTLFAFKLILLSLALYCTPFVIHISYSRSYAHALTDLSGAAMYENCVCKLNTRAGAYT